MNGLYIIQSGKSFPDGSDLQLLAKRPGIEVMVQKMTEGATVWLSPSRSRESMEFFHVLYGSISILLPEGNRILIAGDSFYTEWLEENVQIEVMQPTTLLYVSTSSLFDDLSNIQEKLQTHLLQINDKDHSTLVHSTHVLFYSLKLAIRLERSKSDIDNLSKAALFHDIGKCYVPDEILKKPDRLSSDEMIIMRKHPMDSGRVLEPLFGKKVAEIASHHHERLDGSGYPFGITKDDMSMESRIISIADCFDAMTSERIYNPRRKDKKSAVEELCSLPNLYDQVVCAALKDLLENGELDDPDEEIKLK